MTDLVDQIIKWENDELSLADEAQFFAYLFNARMLDQFQGMYGRNFQYLFDSGYIKIENGRAVSTVASV